MKSSRSCTSTRRQSSLPAGARIGGVVILPSLGPFDPATGEIVGDDMESQLRAVMQNMDRVLRGGWLHQPGRGAGNDLHAPDSAIARPSTRSTASGIRTRINGRRTSTCPRLCRSGFTLSRRSLRLPGNAATAIEIPGIHHNDWMSLGGRNGGFVTSSRIFGTDPTTGKGSPEAERHTAIIFENAERLLALAGGSWANLSQATIFYQGEHLREHVHARMAQRVAATVKVARASTWWIRIWAGRRARAC